MIDVKYPAGTDLQVFYNAVLSKKDMFDLSNFPKDHPLYDPTNHKVPNKLKFEIVENIVSERVHLQSKLYAFKEFNPETGGYEETKRYQGVESASPKT